MNKPTTNTLQSVLEQSVSLFGDKVLSTMGDECVVTYNALGKLAGELRFYLAENGVKPLDKVALISENMPHWGVSYFGITSLGAVVVPVLVDFSIVEIKNILKHSEAKGLIISKKVYNKIGVDLDFEGFIIQINDFSSLPEGNRIETFCMENNDAFKQFTPIQVQPDDLACIIYTSGTTGRSKGVMLTHENLVWDAYQCTTIHPVSDRDVYLSVLPLAHTYECTLGLILGVMQGATTHYIDKAPTANVLMPLLKEIRPTMMLTVPLIIEKFFRVGVKPKLTKSSLMRFLYRIRPIQILLHKAAGKKMLKVFGGNMEFFGIGGAAVAPEVEKFLRDAKFPYSCGYGLTETAPMIFGASVDKTVFRSVGPVMQGVEAKLININPLTGEGEVVVRGKNVMKGYYKEPEITAEVLDDDGWFHTGDLGVLDEKGNLTLKGRSKNMILGSSGENIYPEEIEAIINGMDGVVESVVYQHKGKLVAQVYLNAEEFSKKYHELLKSAINYEEELKKRLDIYLKELKVKVNQSVGKHAQLAELQRTDEPFEKTATLKIKRFTLNKDKQSEKKKA
ncbi:MAG TPA: AMP-binding protein [Bacteroidales bacterium]|nr:AMP-binding protein [Bacteroidales bacterium]